MTRLARVLTPAEMAGRDLVRRRTALALLTVLPLAFYGASLSAPEHAVEVGGVAMAFSVSGAAIFAVLSARAIDRRLVLAGYRAWELVAGRLVLLTGFGAVVATAFSLVIWLGSAPDRPWALLAGVQLVALVSVPFGIAVGALAPRELEAVLIMIGAVGIELSLASSEAAAKTLPFWAPRRLLELAVGDSASAGAMVLVSLAWAVALLAIAGALMAWRLRVTRR